ERLADLEVHLLAEGVDTAGDGHGRSRSPSIATADQVTGQAGALERDLDDVDPEVLQLRGAAETTPALLDTGHVSVAGEGHELAGDAVVDRRAPPRLPGADEVTTGVGGAPIAFHPSGECGKALVPGGVVTDGQIPRHRVHLAEVTAPHRC